MATLAEIRRGVAGMMGDVVVAHASVAVPAPASTVTDPRELLDTTNRYADADLIVIDGPSAGWRARVTGSSLDTYTVNFVPPSPNAIDPGDEVEVYGGRVGMRTQMIDRAINEALQSAWPGYRDAATFQTADIFDLQTDGTITLPSTLTHVHTVYYQDPFVSNRWNEIRPGRPGVNGWDLYPGRRLHLGGTAGWIADGYIVRVDGYAKPARLVDDTDETGIDIEWLTYTAVMRLRAAKSGGEDMQRMGIMGNKADSLRAKIAQNVYPNTRMVIP